MAALANEINEFKTEEEKLKTNISTQQSKIQELESSLKQSSVSSSKEYQEMEHQVGFIMFKSDK